MYKKKKVADRKHRKAALRRTAKRRAQLKQKGTKPAGKAGA